MYARVCDATGWTWDYVGQFLTLPRLNALVKRWTQIPPVSESVAAYLFGASASVSAPASNDEEIPTNESIVRDMNTDPRTVKWQAVHNG